VGQVKATLVTSALPVDHVLGFPSTATEELMLLLGFRRAQLSVLFFSRSSSDFSCQTIDMLTRVLRAFATKTKQPDGCRTAWFKPKFPNSRTVS
jgi:hypothetical protein